MADDDLPIGGLTCPGCGRRHAPSETVCLSCRGSLTPRPEPVGRKAAAERRPMTALFCDIVDSVGLSERLDPEDLLRVYDLYRECCEEIVARHFGFLAQYLGDGILAYFGYPRADEDDAANAVAAGLEMVQRIGGLDIGIDPPLRARVGIATGLVVVSDPVGRGAAATPGIVGKMPNLAARLQSLAAPGGVVISDGTRRVARGRFTYRDLGAVPLKGFTRPVRAWAATAPSEIESRFAAHVQGADTPFVGRTGELGVLDAAWTAAHAGRGAVTLVVGEPGMGKSRLVDAFQARVGGDAGATIKWFCSPQHMESPYYPVIDQIERIAGMGRTDTLELKAAKLTRALGGPDDATLEAFAALLSIPLGRASSLDSASPDRRKSLTIAALMTMLDRLSDAGPVLMIVEDVHWIDASSLELLERVVSRASGSRLCMVVTARPEFRARWADLDGVGGVALERLDPRSAEALCGSLAGSALPLEARRRILARADGNPLFVEELTRAVVESLEGEGAGSGPDGEIAIPQTLHDSLVARLDRLGAARQIANLGAVIGRRFDAALLAEVAALPDETLRDSLRRLSRAGLVVQVTGPTGPAYLFRHALIRDAAYDSLLRADRQKLHARIAATIRDRFDSLAASEPEVMAYHLANGGEEAAAVPYWRLAGDHAASRGAHQEATGHYTAALRLIADQPEPELWARRELSILIALARSLSSAHGHGVDRVQEVLDRARRLCDSLGDDDELVPVLSGLATFHVVRGELATAKPLAERCLRIGEGAGQVDRVIVAHQTLAWVALSRGEYAAARAHLELALALYADHETSALVFDTPQDPKVNCAALLTTVLRMQGDNEGADRVIDEGLAWARRLDRPFDIAFALAYASSAAIARGDMATARTLAAESVEISEANGFDAWISNARLNLGIAVGWSGDAPTAVDIIEPALEAYQANGQKIMGSYFIGQLASFYARVGRLDEALATIDRAIDQAHAHEDLYYLAGLHLARVDIRARATQADHDDLRAEILHAAELARSQGAHALEAQALSRLRRHDKARIALPG